MNWKLLRAKKRKDYDGFLYIYIHTTRTPKTALYVHFMDPKVNSRKPNAPYSSHDFRVLRVQAQIYEQGFAAERIHERVWERTDSQRSDLLRAKKWAEDQIFTPMSHLVQGLTDSI